MQPLGAVPAAAGRNLRETGGRIERLLEEVRSMASPPAWERVEELLRVVLELYTGGLERILAVVSEQGASAERLLQQLTDDQLVASLLVLHGLHPEDLRSRVQKALVQVRPYLGSHGGDVEIVDADTHSGVVRLRMKGSCDGCPSSTLTVKLAVEGAIRELAPEVTRIGPPPAAGRPALGPAGRGEVVGGGPPDRPRGRRSAHPALPRRGATVCLSRCLPGMRVSAHARPGRRHRAHLSHLQPAI